MSQILKLLSRRLLLLNQKISLLSLSSIREKLSYYLLDLSDKQNSLTVRLPCRTYLASYLCIPGHPCPGNCPAHAEGSPSCCQQAEK
ncbi:MAG: hypothetical protein U5N58_05035 [Actinomycetota bacterium]|nr:hypothetical protein [Actinomycetota bacterium]